MNIEVRYLSKSGNTKKVGDAIAAALNITAKPITEQVWPGTDILFLGGAVYGFGIDASLKTFIQDLHLSSVQTVAIFSTTAVVKSAYSHIKPLLDEQGIHVSETEFHCRGAFKFMHRGRPNADDLKQAEEFARAVVDSFRR